MRANIELNKLGTVCMNDVSQRFGDNMEDLERVHCECSPATSDSVIALKNKAYPKVYSVHVYTYDRKLDRLTHYQWAGALLQYADNFSEQLEKAIVKKEENSDG